MNYEILGEIRVIGGAGIFVPRAGKVEALLAILLVRANQVVTTDQLVAEIWGETPPNRANAALYVYVSQLRKLLRESETEDSPIITRPRGYVLRVDAKEFDAEKFDQLYQQGRNLHRARCIDAAADTLKDALRLWRGPAFGGLIEIPIVNAYSTLLEESRLECLELLMETELLIGRHREIIRQLSALTNEHTLRETLYRYLMVALHRCGRRAEALEVFVIARKRLNEQLGVEPCRSLRELHQNILADKVCVAV